MTGAEAETGRADPGAAGQAPAEPRRRRACLIANPVSGVAFFQADLGRAVAPLREAGWGVDVVETRGPGHARALAERAVRAGYDTVLAAGGDGTANEVAQPLVGTGIDFGVVPIGTANILARQVGLPLEPAAAGAALARATARRIDVGLAGDRYFLLWAGIGFDAEVARGLEPTIKRALGVPAIAVASFWTGLWFEGSPTELRIDGLRLHRQTLLTIVANAGLYALMELSRDARLDDGLFDVCIFNGRGLGAKLRHVLNLLRGRHRGSRQVEFYRARQVWVAPRRAMPIQLDGEPTGFTPVHIRLIPRALNLLVAGEPAALSRPPAPASG